LTLLMNEVGAQEYLEKEKPGQGPAGNA
jgi:hypothetical protein